MSTTSESRTITRDPGWSGPAISPGEMLLEEFLKPLGLRQTEAARRLGISANRLNEVVLGKRRITADTALRLSRLLRRRPSSGCGYRRTGTSTGRPNGRRPEARAVARHRTVQADRFRLRPDEESQGQHVEPQRVAQEQVGHCLAETIATRIADRADIPVPDLLNRRQARIAVPVHVAVKGALYVAIRQEASA